MGPVTDALDRPLGQGEHPGCVAELLRRSAAERADRIAATDLSGSAVSFGDLDAASAALAAELTARAARPGLVVASMPNCLAAMTVVFAAFRTEHALAMLHPALPAEVRDEAMARVRPIAEIRWDGAELAVVTDPYGPGKALWQPPRRRPELGIALCVMTSGTTGRPRLIAAPHRQVRTAVTSIGACLGYRPDDVVPVVSPLSFDYGLYQLLLSVAAGATVVLDPRLDTVQGVLVGIARTGATVLALVPTMLRSFVASPFADRLDLTGVRLVTTTGDLLTEVDIAAARRCFPAAEILPMYGLSECKRVAISPPRAARPSGAVGIPLDGTDVAIGDKWTPRGGPGTAGELIVSGPHLTLGYLDDVEATATRFTVDPHNGQRLLRTGDQLRQDSDGWLYWVGRGSDVIKTSGYRVDPAELETAAAACEAVWESGAYGRTDPDRGQIPVLVVRLRTGTPATTGRQAVADTLARLLPRWAVPHLEIRTEPLPRTRNGKVDRARLAADPGTQPDLSSDPAMASDEKQWPFGRPPAASRNLINCHTQALLSAYPLAPGLTPAVVELATTVPFGVRACPDDPNRLLIPYLDPDLGLDRAARLLGLSIQTRWHRDEEGDAAASLLDEWLCTGPVLLGPLDLGGLAYHEFAGTLRGCDHYLVALGRAEGGGLVALDPEGFVSIEIDRDTLHRAWAGTAVPEGRGRFTLRRLVPLATTAPPAELFRRIRPYALDNILAAGRHRYGGAAAYRALAGQASNPSRRRALSMLVPVTAARYRLAAELATNAASTAPDGRTDRSGWERIAELLEDQVAALALLHLDVLTNRPAVAKLLAAADIEDRLAAVVEETRRSAG